LTYVSGDGTLTWTMTIAETINNGDTCNLDFDGNATSIIDPSNNYVVDFTNQSISNNSTQGMEPTPPGGITVTVGGGSQTISIGGGTQVINW